MEELPDIKMLGQEFHKVHSTLQPLELQAASIAEHHLEKEQRQAK